MNTDCNSPEVLDNPLSRKSKVVYALGAISAGSLLIANINLDSHPVFESVVYGATGIVGGVGYIAYEACRSVKRVFRQSE